jgi:AraC-like DNA-binding protein
MKPRGGRAAFAAATRYGNLLVDIAYATGFSPQANFNRAFRKAVGTKPSAYRAQKLRD